LAIATVAQISNLLYRRFAIGRLANLPGHRILSKARQAETLRYSRLEICATRFVEEDEALPVIELNRRKPELRAEKGIII